MLEACLRHDLVLEANNDVVGISHDDHVARGLPPSPAVGPQVEHVVQVDVGEQRRDHRALSRPLVTYGDNPVLQDTRLQPLLDQADDARITDPVLDEANEPALADLVEKGSDVRVENEAHTLAGGPDHERVQRIMLPAFGPEPVAEPEELLLVD